jgi:hypothetical protein
MANEAYKTNIQANRKQDNLYHLDNKIGEGDKPIRVIAPNINNSNDNDNSVGVITQ